MYDKVFPSCRSLKIQWNFKILPNKKPHPFPLIQYTHLVRVDLGERVVEDALDHVGHLLPDLRLHRVDHQVAVLAYKLEIKFENSSTFKREYEWWELMFF